MTQEEKLEEAKSLYKDANADQRYALERLFPELKESEVEKNIKNLIDELKCSLRAANCQNDACGGGHEKRIALLEWSIDWLEKQGKHKPWSKNDEHRIKAIIYFLDIAKKHYASTVEIDVCIDWLKSIKPQNML